MPPGPTRSVCSKNAGRTQPAQPRSFPSPSPCGQTAAGRAQLSQLDPGQDDRVNNPILAGTVTVYLLIPTPSPPQHLGAPAGTKPAAHPARLSIWGRAGPRRPGRRLRWQGLYQHVNLSANVEDTSIAAEPCFSCTAFRMRSLVALMFGAYQSYWHVS